MKPIHVQIFLVLLSVCSGKVEARIGESIEQCIARYGEPEKRYSLPDNKEEIQFHTNAFTISAEFLNGVCDWISYTKPKKKAFWSKKEEWQHLTDGEIGVLMEANSNGKPWERFSGEDCWYRTDDYDLEARYFKDLRILTISSKISRDRHLHEAYEYSGKYRSNEIEKAKTQMDGF